MAAIKSEWTNTSRSYADRVSNIKGTTTTGSNAPYYLQPGTTALDDTAVDSLYGDAGNDWFFHSSIDDVVNDEISGEELTPLA